MAKEPFISQEERPNLTINLEGRVGDLTVRELASVLGIDPSQAPKAKELPSTAADKTAKEVQKDIKDRKEAKEHKDHKEPKDHKDQKEAKDHKDPKEHKDQKDSKDQKEHKDPKDSKDQKDQKDPKEHKDQKDHKDPKEHKDQKDHKELKETLKEIKEGHPDIVDKGDVEGGPQPPAGTSELDALIQYVQGEFDKADRNTRPDPGRVTARRLNRSEYTNSGGTLVGTATTQVTLTTSWQQVTVSYTVGSPGTTNLDFNAYLSSADAPPGTCFYADDVSIIVT